MCIFFHLSYIFYILRIGRTGRAGKTGKSVTLFTRDQFYNTEFSAICQYRKNFGRLDDGQNIEIAEFRYHWLPCDLVLPIRLPWRFARYLANLKFWRQLETSEFTNCSQRRLEESWWTDWADGGSGTTCTWMAERRSKEVIILHIIPMKIVVWHQ